MAREVRFRAWYKPEKRMIYDIQNEFEERIELGMNCFADYLNNDDFIVEQETDLEDKNGKEIWGGDIVRVSYGYNYEVRRFKSGAWRIGRDDLCAWADSSEVIGNIHENPELLEEK